MKLMHLSDLHLGKSLKEFDLIDDQKFILDQIVDLAQREAVTGVLLAGDIYDKSIPSEAAVNLLDEFLMKLNRAGVAVYMIPGNHDSDDRLNFGSTFFRNAKIYIASKYEGALAYETLSDEYGELNIYMLPYIRASYVRHCHEDATINNYEDAVRTVIEHAKLDPTKRNIMIAHQFVIGGEQDPELEIAGSEGMSVTSVGNVEKISYHCFDAFDYVALGHIHSPQRVGRDTVRYAGSPLKYSMKEVSNQKSVPIITLNEKGNVSVELKPLVPLRNMRSLKGTLSELVQLASTDPHNEDYLDITLTDESYVDSAMSILQQHYPYAMQVHQISDDCETDFEALYNAKNQGKSFEELFADFYQSMYGIEMSEEEVAMMQEAAREVGLVHETEEGHI